MQVHLEPLKPETSKLTNPEERVALSERKKDSIAQSIDCRLVHVLEENLKNHFYEEAKLASKSNAFLSKFVNLRILFDQLNKLATQTFESSELKNLDMSFEGVDKQDEKLFHAIKQMKAKTSLNSSLISTLSTILNDINHGIYPEQLQKGLNRRSSLQQKIFKPLIELHRRLSQKMPRQDSQLAKKLRQKYEQCKLHQSKIDSLSRQLELVKNSLNLKTAENNKVKKDIKLTLAQNIKLKDLSRANKQSQKLIKVHQEYIKYIENLHKVYVRNEQAKIAQNFSSFDIIDDESGSIDNFIARLHQSITYHRSNFNQLLLDHQKELDDTKKHYQEQMEQMTLVLQDKFKMEMEIHEKRYKEQNNEIQGAFKESKEKVIILENQIKEFNQKLAVLAKEKGDLLSKISFQNKKLSEKILSLQKKIKLRDQELQAQRQNNKSLGESIQSHKMLSIMQANEKERQKNQQIQVLESQLTEAKNLIGQLELKYSQQSRKIQNLSRQLEQMSAMYQQLKSKQKSETEQRLQPQKESNFANNQQKQESIQRIKAEHEELLGRIQLLNKEKQKQMTQKQQLLIKMEEVTAKNSSLQKMLQFQKTKTKESDQKYNIADKKIKSFLADVQFRKIYPEQYVDNIFGNEILDSEPGFKLFLKSTLENRYKSRIFRTNLLYKLDPLNKNNFHQYIDNKDNLFVLVKLVNGSIVAAFSQNKIYPKMVPDKDGLLISVSNKEVFELAQTNKRAVYHDDYFFILGNSEFRVKSGQLKFFSNFAVSNGYYKPRGHKINIITGSNDRQVAMSYLEFYQIVFY